MSQMLGKLAATAVYCLCCNDPRTHGQQRAKKAREWRREQEHEDQTDH